MLNRVVRWVKKNERIHNILRRILENEKVHYALRCARHINDLEFVHDVVSLESNPNIIRLVRKGEKHKGKILYKVDVGSAGFFAEFRYILLQMYVVDAYGAYPIVVASEKFPYYEKDGVDGKTNPWEYYFLQYSDMRTEDLNESYVVMKDAVSLWNVEKVREISTKEIMSYRPGKKFYTELAPIVSKYIRLQPKVEKYIKDNIDTLLGGKKTLGVQIRMGGMLANYDGHPVVPTLKDYEETMQSIMEKGNYEQIFLATDDKRPVEYMKKKFGRKLLYYKDVTRVRAMCSPYDVNKEQELHQYRCGLEVLRDMYTLVACDGLVSGLSQVSIVARIVKMSRKEEYEHLVIIDKGINSNNRKAGSDETRELIKREAKVSEKR